MAEKNDKKLCPLRNTMQFHACDEIRCALWNSDEEKCSIATIATRLSEIDNAIRLGALK